MVGTAEKNSADSGRNGSSASSGRNGNRVGAVFWNTRRARWAFVLGLVGSGLVAFSLSRSARRLVEDLAEALHVDRFVRDGIFGMSPWTIAHVGLWTTAALVVGLVVGADRLWWAIGAMLIGALGIEVLQWTSGRGHFEGSDLAASATGILLGAGLAGFLIWARETVGARTQPDGIA